MVVSGLEFDLSFPPSFLKEILLAVMEVFFVFSALPSMACKDPQSSLEMDLPLPYHIRRYFTYASASRGGVLDSGGWLVTV